jgi:predicted DNA-binding transcriptional regulator YafY
MGPKTRRTRPGESSAPEKPRLGARVRWNVEQRLVFIEDRLFWLRAVNRNDLMERFGVSTSQASADIAQYLALKPKGVEYDKSAKRYVAGDDFHPLLSQPDATKILGELRLVEFGLVSGDDMTFGSAPPFAATPLPDRPIDPLVLRALLAAIREHEAVSVRYQSMSRPEPTRRTIEPHALAHDGFRWHVRAFDRESGAFRDFVVGRISAPRADGRAQSNPEDDEEWNSFVSLEIAPHPKLTEAQTRAIAADYGIRGTSTKIRVRRSLLFYALKRLGLDVPADARPPNEQQIVLVNRKEIDALTKRADT